MKRALTLFLAMVMLFALTACNNSGDTGSTGTTLGTTAPAGSNTTTAPPPADPTKDTITLLGAGDLESFDPIGPATQVATTTKCFFAQLCQYDDSLNVVPMLAEKWEDNGDSVTFTLRSDAKFSDGSPITSDDVIYTIETMMAEPRFATYGVYLGPCEKIDALTFSIAKASVSADIPGVLAYGVSVVPKAAHGADPEAYGKMPSVVSGPYVPHTKDADGTVHATANEYFIEEVKIKNLVIRAPLDPSTAAVALENGEIDIALNLPTEIIQTLEGNANITTISTPMSGMHIMIFTGEALQKDLNLRKAIFHAVNVDNMLLITENGYGQPAQGMRQQQMLDLAPNTYTYIGYDEALAREYLAQSDYDGKVFTITTGGPLAATMAQSVQADLDKIGIKVELESLDVNNWAAKVLSGQAEINIQSFFYGGFATPDSDWQIFLSSSPYYGMYMANSERYDVLVGLMQTEPDKDIRYAYAQEASQIMYDIAAYRPLYDMIARAAQTNDISRIPNSEIASGGLKIWNLSPMK